MLSLGGCSLFAPLEPLTVRIAASPLQGEVPLTVHFSVSVEDLQVAKVRYLWDFNGDGLLDAEGEGPEIEALFKRVGTYWVTVEVVDEGGRRGSEEVMVQALPPSEPVVVVGGDVDPRDVWLEPFQTGAAKLSVEGASQGVRELRVEALTYDPQVIEILEVQPLPPFRLQEVAIDDVQGWATFTVSGAEAAQGESVEVAEILLRARGTAGEESPLSLQVGRLIDQYGRTLRNFRALEGRVRVQ